MMSCWWAGDDKEKYGYYTRSGLKGSIHLAYCIKDYRVSSLRVKKVRIITKIFKKTNIIIIQRIAYTSFPKIWKQNYPQTPPQTSAKLHFQNAPALHGMCYSHCHNVVHNSSIKPPIRTPLQQLSPQQSFIFISLFGFVIKLCFGDETLANLKLSKVAILKNPMYSKEKKNLCSAEKGFVIWAEPNSRSWAETNVQTVSSTVYS